jgi:hypothetical protein
VHRPASRKRWRPVNVEVALVAIEQRQGIAGAIEFQKFEFVGCRGEVAARRGVVDISPLSLAWLRLQVRGALDTLRLSQTLNLPVQFQLVDGLILHGRFQRRNLVL